MSEPLHYSEEDLDRLYADVLRMVRKRKEPTVEENEHDGNDRSISHELDDFQPPFTVIRDDATTRQLAAATRWTADNLHVNARDLPPIVVVAYVCKHFSAGQLTGWSGFITDLENWS